MHQSIPIFAEQTDHNTMRYLLLISFVLVLSSCGSSRKVVSKRPGSKPAHNLKTEKIKKEAHGLLGAPYKYGGDSPRGFDCSGLVFYLYHNNGIRIARTSRDQSKQGHKVSLSGVKAGDLMFFGSGGVDHVGIVYSTRGKYPQMIHSSSSKGVIMTDINNSDYWRKRFLFATRVY